MCTIASSEFITVIQNQHRAGLVLNLDHDLTLGAWRCLLYTSRNMRPATYAIQLHLSLGASGKPT